MARRTLPLAACTVAILAWWFSQDLYVRAQGGGVEAAENGDVNGDLSRDLADAIYLLNWIFEGGPGPVPIAGAASPDGKPKVVDCACDDGHTLTEALTRARAGDTIRVTGTCTERVTITTDRITLDGGGTAVVDGGGGERTEFDGVIAVDGARGVTIKGLTVRNGPGEGILASHGAVLTVSDSTVEENSGAGIALDNAAADLVDCTLQGNAGGLDMFRMSTAVLKGSINAVDNGGVGITVNSQSMLEIRGATVHADRNGVGLAIDHSTAGIYGFSRSQGSTITADDNSGDGMAISGGSLTVFGGSFFGSGANTISASGNGAAGVWLPGWGKIVAPFATARFVIESNTIGLNFGDGSGAAIIGGLSVRNNKTGVLADGAGSLSFVSVPPNPSVIEDNETDVELLFGSRLTAGGVPLGPVKCDGTALIRGSAVCP